MPKNPFAPSEEDAMKLKRTAYDLSNRRLQTSEWGRLDPIQVIEVVPGQTVEIDSTVTVQGMPTVFPLQNPVKVSVSYYYGRNRTMQDHFEDMIFKTKEIEHPWLRISPENAKKQIGVGSLGDLMGVPCTKGDSDSLSLIIPFDYRGTFGFRPYSVDPSSIIDNYIGVGCSGLSELPNTDNSTIAYALFLGFISKPLSSTFKPFFQLGKSSGYDFSVGSSISIGILKNGFVQHIEPLRLTFTSNSKQAVSPTFLSDNFIEIVNNQLEETGNPVQLFIAYYYAGVQSGFYTFSPYINTGGGLVYFLPPYNTSNQSLYFNLMYGAEIIESNIKDATDDDVVEDNPFVGTEPKEPLNVFPFRLYEMICNYYYRNDKNNPYYLDGEVQYNEFIPTHGDGADDNVYDFHYRNWELDRFTSAVQSPQFGEAPLVGLTYNPDGRTATLKFDNSGEQVDIDGSAPAQLTATVGYDADGRLTDIADFSKELPSANIRKLMDQVNMGISINDLRVTNSFQRFLENTLRRGLRYRNQLKSHFGTSVDYPDIDIPQYIGGYSGYLNVGRNTNMADSPSAGLGDFNGQLFGSVSSGRKIKCYCPEHGFIIGIVSITPIPIYPQSIPKVLIKHHPFDYFLPEFGKIGFVPMHYSEVMPLQTGAGEDLDDVFGYQRAWYDYMQSYDTVHGDFRTTLRDFYVGRYFAQRPELAEDFTTVNPEHLNNVFVTNNIADRYNSAAKFLLNVAHHVISVSPIPRIGTPSLE